MFAAGSALAGRMLPASLAAHQIALNLAGFTYMVPLGLASAGAVRVGHAIGRGDAAGAARAGWTALLFGVSFMSVASLTFIAIPRVLLGAFTTDPRVVELGVTLLAVAAVFQLFDGLQGVATGVLRGLGDTRTPMFWNLARPLGHRSAARLPPRVPLRLRGDRAVVGLVLGPDHLRYRSAGRLVAPDPRDRAVSPGQRLCWRRVELALVRDAVGRDRCRRIGIARARTGASRQDWHGHDPRRRARSRRRLADRRRLGPDCRTPARRSRPTPPGGSS